MRIVGSKTRAERSQPRGRIQGGTLARPKLAGVETSRFVICKSSHIINSLHSWRRVKCVFQPQYSCGPPLSRELTREKHERLFIAVASSLAGAS